MVAFDRENYFLGHNAYNVVSIYIIIRAAPWRLLKHFGFLFFSESI